MSHVPDMYGRRLLSVTKQWCQFISAHRKREICGNCLQWQTCVSLGIPMATCALARCCPWQLLGLPRACDRPRSSMWLRRLRPLSSSYLFIRGTPLCSLSTRQCEHTARCFIGFNSEEKKRYLKNGLCPWGHQCESENLSTAEHL